jgi:flagellar L-ring protein precursor FlgH
MQADKSRNRKGIRAMNYRNIRRTVMTCGVSTALSFSALAVFGTEETENIKLALNMYSNQRAHSIGDLLMIVINEATASSKSESLNTDKSADASADAPYFGAPFGGSAVNLFKNVASSNASGEIYRIKGTSTFKGTGSAASAETLATTFSVRIVDKLENGVMVVRGERKVLMKNESYNVVLTGLVRERDIDSSNMVNSTRVADARIYYENGGEVTRGTRPGYAWRLFQFLNPL